MGDRELHGLFGHVVRLDLQYFVASASACARLTGAVASAMGGYI